MFAAALAVLSLTATMHARAQAGCLTSVEVQKVIASMPSSGDPDKADKKQGKENKKLRKEIIDMYEAQRKINDRVASDLRANQAVIPEANKLSHDNLIRLCSLIKENGWLTSDMLGSDGLAAVTTMVVNNRDYAAQRELLPVLIEAAKRALVPNATVASMIDAIRTAGGSPQIFGTQATMRSDAIYIYPLADPDRVEEWRRNYGLSSLAYQIRELEWTYGLPVLKMRSPGKKQKGDAKTDIAALGITDDEKDAVVVETRLVSLNVRVLNKDLSPTVNLDLSKQNFVVAENGVKQDVSFFSSSEKPFDLVLLLDFSGSTREKQGLIKKAAQRFVTAARPQDRIAVVAFATGTITVCDLTGDKEVLQQKIKDIDLDGDSPVWDSLNYTFQNIIDKESSGRRSSVVFMTDGVDSGRGMAFADLLDVAQKHDTTIFPVALNVEGYRYDNGLWGRVSRAAHSYLSMLAEETGGQLYEVRDLKDLNGAYDQVINDLSRVYSLGYEPKNESRDGDWRDLTVTVVGSQPGLVARTRRGYYAK